MFAVHRVTVHGAVDAAAVRARVEAVIGHRSLLAIDPQAVADAVASLPDVRRASVDRAFPNELRIDVVPEVAVATVATSTGRYAIAASGRVIGPAGKAALPLLVSEAGTMLPPPGGIVPASLADQLHVAAAVHGHRSLALRAIRVSDLGLAAVTGKGMTLELGTGAEIERKLLIARSMLAQRPGDNQTGVQVSLRYIDVSTPDRPVYRSLSGDPATVGRGGARGAIATTDQPTPSTPVDQAAAAIAQLFVPASVSMAT
jgi:cell division septal protein FtsQ